METLLSRQTTVFDKMVTLSCNLLFSQPAPMETLLSRQTTVFDKMVTLSCNLLFSQPAGGRYLQAVRSQSGDSCR